MTTGRKLVQQARHSRTSTPMIPTVRALLHGVLLLLLSSPQTQAFVQARSINSNIGSERTQQHEPRLETLPAAAASRTDGHRIFPTVSATTRAHEGVISREDMVAISMQAVSVGATTAALNVLVSHPGEAAAARSNEELVRTDVVNKMATAFVLLCATTVQLATVEASPSTVTAVAASSKTDPTTECTKRVEQSAVVCKPRLPRKSC